MDTMYDPPSGIVDGGSKKNKNIMQYKYDESSGRVRRVSQQERERVCGIKKKYLYLGTGFFILMGVLAGVLVAFHVDIPVDQGAPAAVSTYKLCKTDKDCLGDLECFLSDDVIEDESERAKEYHGQCLKPTETIRHCKKSTDCTKGYVCTIDNENFRGMCAKQPAMEETPSMNIDFVQKLSSNPERRRLGASGQVCCNAYIASCLACSNGQSVEEYCAENMHGDVPGCPEHHHHHHDHEEGKVTKTIEEKIHHHHDHRLNVHEEHHDHDHTETVKTHSNGIVSKEKQRWKSEGIMHPYNPSGDHDDGVCGAAKKPRQFLDENGNKVKHSNGRRLASIGSQCAYHQCDIPENRDKFLNVKLTSKIPVEYYVVTDENGNYPSRRVEADFADSIDLLNQKYGPMGLEFNGEIKGIKNNDLFMMNVGAIDSWKSKLEGTMVQDILIEKGFNAQKTLFPVKPLSVMKGKYDWQYLRTGDTLQIHRSVEKGFAADELMEEGLIETKAADEMKKDESKHGKRSRMLRQATYGYDQPRTYNRERHSYNGPASSSYGNQRRQYYQPRPYNRRSHPYWGPAPRQRRPSYGSRYSRRSRQYRKIIKSYKKDKLRLKHKLTRMFIKLFLDERKEKETTVEEPEEATTTTTVLEKEASPPAVGNTDANSDTFSDAFTIYVYKCTTCKIVEELCPIVSSETPTCEVVDKVEKTFAELENSAYEFKPQGTGWYAIQLDFSKSGPTTEQKVLQLNVKMDGSYMSTEDIFEKMGTRKKETNALQFYIFNVAVDKYLGWAFPPAHATDLELGTVVINNYRLTKGSSTLPHELGHSLGLWHTFHGTHEQGVYDENGDVVFDGETKEQVKKRNNQFEQLLKKKTKVGNLKKARALAAKGFKNLKNEMKENPLEFIADQGSCPVCVESPGAPDSYRDRVGDFCSDTRPIPKQFQCENPSSDGICGSNWGETPYNNIMSYGKDTCREVFTAQQKARMLCYIHTVPKLAKMMNLKVVENVGAFTSSESALDVAAFDALVDDIDEVGHPFGSDEGRSVERSGKKNVAKAFPNHWGQPPLMQTRDLVKLPKEYGYGSSTLKHWIMKNMEKDGNPIV